MTGVSVSRASSIAAGACGLTPSTCRACLRKLRHPLRRLAPSDGPVIQPIRSFFSDVFVRQAVSRIAERIFQGDKSIAPLANHVQQLADMLRFQEIRVQ